ncbi:M48 family metallopeptidase [Umboniibacter marinipuniceus]|uniref:Zn-dependent protease with chaperone function n=1 Tax=Umboniibacter marinipuniceus TaxID=569599 RepID=A0A3M0ACH9_9GAMM|nr:M48 family metallopeptidase [Umboniibacter marinipuniceus]RMA80155.1 Zn-dependent protease with chaperone function [Umboniibacter marinipuniceus]
MQFFDEQDRSRRQSRLLLSLFALAVLALLAVTHFAFYGMMLFVDNANTSEQGVAIYWWADALILITIAGASFYRWLTLRRGGIIVAQELGGELVDINDGQRYLQAMNIVEEMAVAATTPAPSLFILKNEQGINAFAAGSTPSNAVIALTQGAIDNLNRDQVQAVVAHEFGHIVNRDIRINFQMMALLFGIEFIALIGRHAMAVVGSSRPRRNSSSGKGTLAIAVIGGVLFLFGSIGAYLAKLIKLAVNRQREYLADATAVEFTRYPEALATALTKISQHRTGGRVLHENTSAMAHLFFYRPLGSWSGRGTHPPLADRVARLGYQLDALQDALAEKLVSPPVQKTRSDGKVASSSLLNEAHQRLAGLSPSLVAAAHNPSLAAILIPAIVIQRATSSNGSQVSPPEALTQGLDQSALSCLNELTANLETTGPSSLLALTEITLPTLKQLPPSEQRKLRKKLKQLLEHAEQPQAFQWCLAVLVEFYLEQEPPHRPSIRSMRKLKGPLSLVIWSFFTLGETSTQLQDNIAELARNALGFDIAKREATPVEFSHFLHAVQRINCATPLIKRNLLNLLEKLAQADNVSTQAELDMLKSLSIVWDCPLKLR